MAFANFLIYENVQKAYMSHPFSCVGSYGCLSLGVPTGFTSVSAGGILSKWILETGLRSRLEFFNGMLDSLEVTDLRYTKILEVGSSERS